MKGNCERPLSAKALFQKPIQLTPLDPGCCPQFPAGPAAPHRCNRVNGLSAGAGAYLAALASATVSAVMLTMRRTVADGVRMCAGLSAPTYVQMMRSNLGALRGALGGADASR